MPSAATGSFSSPTDGPIRCKDLWFEDGNLVITSEHTIFRVYRSQLAQLSPFFQDHFRLAGLTKSTGCYSMHREEDSYELAHFLKAIFIADYFVRNIKSSPKEIDFAVLSAVLRLSSRFEVDHLRQQCMMHLAKICPTSLQVFDLRRESFAATSLSPDVLPVAIIKLARETKVHAVLPFAMYRYSTQPLDELLDGDLDWEDKRACIIARQEFNNHLRGNVFGFLLGRGGEDAFSDCQSRTLCALERLAFLNMREDAFSSGNKGPLDYEPNWDNVGNNLCRPCTIAFKTSFDLARQDFWDELPMLLGLPRHSYHA